MFIKLSAASASENATFDCVTDRFCNSRWQRKHLHIYYSSLVYLNSYTCSINIILRKFYRHDVLVETEPAVLLT